MPREARKPPMQVAVPMPSHDRTARSRRPWRHASVTNGCHRGLRCRQAYSLLELMIVLAILTALAGMSWPALMRPWSKSLVQQAGQEFARELNRTRGLAIERSSAFHLRWRPNGAEYQIVRSQDPATADRPLDANAGSLSSAVDAGATAVPPANDASVTSPGATLSGVVQPASAFRLPEGVRFRATAGGERGTGVRELNANPAAMPSFGSDSARLEALSPAEDASPADGDANGLDSLLADSSTWSGTVSFYPDGRATNARWTLVSGEGYELEVSLRGLTGMATVGPVRATAREVAVELMDGAAVQDAPAGADNADMDRQEAQP